MALPLPTSLTPSKVSAFRDCALAFRFSVIDRLPEPPSPPAVKGTLVHRALERLFWNHPQGDRSLEVALGELDAAWRDLMTQEELPALALDDEQAATFKGEAAGLIERYFALEDPDATEPVGVEVVLQADLPGFRLRGIIDRLDRTAEGELVVVDYKTGRAPSERFEQASLAGVHIYALLCEEVFGQRPAAVRLMYLREQVAISTVPSEQTVRGFRQRTAAVWAAIERACETEDFRPRPSSLCDWCSFRAYCPAVGGDPQAAPVAAPIPA